MSSLPSLYYQDLAEFDRFVCENLTPHQSRVLELLSSHSLSQKEVALKINRSIKTIERIKTSIGKAYCQFFETSERETTFKKIERRAACYYYLRDLLHK